MESTPQKKLENICKLKDLSPTSNSVNVYCQGTKRLSPCAAYLQGRDEVKVGEILVGDNTAKIL